MLNSINNNFATNIIGTFFENNTCDYYFNTNTIGSQFQRNKIGIYFQSNNIGDNFTDNLIGNNFGNNTISSSCFIGNNITIDFANNTITALYSDTLLANIVSATAYYGDGSHLTGISTFAYTPADSFTYYGAGAATGLLYTSVSTSASQSSETRISYITAAGPTYLLTDFIEKKTTVGGNTMEWIRKTYTYTGAVLTATAVETITSWSI